MESRLTVPGSEGRATAKAADRAVRAMRAEKRADDRRGERAIRAAARKRAWRAAGRVARRAAPVIGAAVPVALVNATAFIGQFAWVQDHVPWPVPLQVMFAVALESVAIYLAWHAHLAQVSDDSSGRLKLSAYLFALVIGAMNYSHYAPHWRPDALAVALGLMSALSPWLWGVHSRRASRDRLKAQGLIEGHAVRLGANRWLWHPWRSVQVMYHATWDGENNPQRAIAMLAVRQEARRASRATSKAVPAPARQAAPERAVPAVPTHPVPELPAGTAGRAVPEAPRATVPERAVPVAPQGAVPAPEVRAIAALRAVPEMGALHPIDPQRLADAEQYLFGLPVSGLPGQRAVSAMLCGEHNHRRQAAYLLQDRRAAGPDAIPAFVQRQRPADFPTTIASPVSTLPGGKQANG